MQNNYPKAYFVILRKSFEKCPQLHLGKYGNKL